jgi:hypothetical protein
VTRYDLFRRRIAPIAFGVAIALLARESCNKREHADATFAFDFGSAATRVQSIDVDLYDHGDFLSHFHRDALAGSTIGPTQFKAALPDVDGELRIDVSLATPPGVRHVVRTFHADDNGTVTIPLERDLQ